MASEIPNFVVLLATCDQLRGLDQRLEMELGLRPVDLMEIAGLGCFFGVSDLLTPGARVVVASGPGHNGGDGFVVARYAAAAGFDARVFATSEPKPGSGPALQLDRLASFGVPVVFGDTGALETALGDADIIVDAILGTGMRQPLSALAVAWIEAINASRAFVAAIDLPSGLDGDTGQAASGCVRAHRTLTIGALKPGVLTQNGAAAAGAVRVVPLPYPPRMVAHLPRVALRTPGA